MANTNEMVAQVASKLARGERIGTRRAALGTKASLGSEWSPICGCTSCGVRR